MADGPRIDIGETPCVPVRGPAYRPVMVDDIVPGDSKDWTWVLERACPECGVDPGSIDVETIPELVRDNAAA